MSDHLDSPGPVVLTASTTDGGPNEGLDALFPDNKDGLDSVSIGPPNGDQSTDITDVYAFLKPDDAGGAGGLPGKSILILNVNPLAPAFAKQFESGAEYLIKVDTNGDAVEDITFRFTFSPGTGDSQTAKVERIDGAGAKVILDGAPVSFDAEARITIVGPYKFFAGLRSDPFFFDLLGFIDDLNFVNGDFFTKLNVFSIVLEVPNSALGKTPATTSLWGRTRIMRDGSLVNDDIAARAAINTVFNHGQDKVVFNGIEPSQERNQTLASTPTVTFLQSFAATVTALTGDAAYGDAIAHALLPDVLNYDFSKPTDYATLNGRRLPDDVIGISLSLITKGALTTDNVLPHTDYLDHFPYVGTPH